MMRGKGNFVDNRILLHTCCGPCAEAPVRDLLQEGYAPTLYYYNPNIHPIEEWEKRLEGVRQLAALLRLPLLVEEGCTPEEWRRRVEDGEASCRFCYRIRLDRTAEAAAEHGFSQISTTLLVSPYQNREAICAEMESAAQAHGLTFLAKDWRPLFREGQNQAREDGLYRQKYCGCILSLETSRFREKIEKQHAQWREQKGE